MSVLNDTACGVGSRRSSRVVADGVVAGGEGIAISPRLEPLTLES